jgi:chromate reductase, NAD(P)H dehydrogenase (quinone)
LLNVLAISGSLRKLSINSAACRAMAALAVAPLAVTVFGGMSALPLFNPDRERNLPAAVRELRGAVSASDALVIASPEYAHGISGVMKNALDWLVGHEDTANKPVAILNTSLRARHADAALREVLTTMSVRVVEEACIRLPLQGATLTDRQIASTPGLRLAMEAALQALSRHVSNAQRAAAR